MLRGPGRLEGQARRPVVARLIRCTGRRRGAAREPRAPPEVKIPKQQQRVAVCWIMCRCLFSVPQRACGGGDNAGTTCQSECKSPTLSSETMGELARGRRSRYRRHCLKRPEARANVLRWASGLTLAPGQQGHPGREENQRPTEQHSC